MRSGANAARAGSVSASWRDRDGLSHPRSTIAAGEAATPEAGVIPTDQDCESVNAWVAANEANLPTEYDELIHFPDSYRRAIAAALPPAAQSSLWQQHLQAYLAAHPGLTAEQRVFIEKASATLSPELFAEHDGEAPGPEAATLIAALEAEAAALFSEAEGYSLLATLGPDEAMAEHVPLARPKCACSTASDWCNHEGPGYRCKKRAANCTPRGGCGTPLRHTCNGLCVR